MAMPEHGGSLVWAESRFGRPAAGWVDLSTGLNPWPHPLPPVAPETWQRLPDARAVADLLTAAAGHYGVPDPACIVAAPGTQTLIQLLPRLSRPTGRTAILGFTYAEHAHRWRMAGHEVTVIASLDEAAACDTVVVVNPNNPDGRRVPPDRLLDLAARLAARGGRLIVDEAFADVVPEVSVATQAGQQDGLVVLRSFGKFFGLAGIRLGFAVAPPTLARSITAELGPWAVAGPALAVGRAALADAAWIAATRHRLAAAARALDATLSAHGLNVAGGTDLFRLVHTERAMALFEVLGARGILVRAFPERPDYLRIGLPADAAARRRLAEALGARDEALKR